MRILQSAGLILGVLGSSMVDGSGVNRVPVGMYTGSAVQTIDIMGQSVTFECELKFEVKEMMKADLVMHLRMSTRENQDEPSIHFDCKDVDIIEYVREADSSFGISVLKEKENASDGSKITNECINGMADLMKQVTNKEMSFPYRLPYDAETNSLKFKVMLLDVDLRGVSEVVSAGTLINDEEVKKVTTDLSPPTDEKKEVPVIDATTTSSSTDSSTKAEPTVDDVTAPESPGTKTNIEEVCSVVPRPIGTYHGLKSRESKSGKIWNEHEIQFFFYDKTNEQGETQYLVDMKWWFGMKASGLSMPKKQTFACDGLPYGFDGKSISLDMKSNKCLEQVNEKFPIGMRLPKEFKLSIDLKTQVIKFKINFLLTVDVKPVEGEPLANIPSGIEERAPEHPPAVRRFSEERTNTDETPAESAETKPSNIVVGDNQQQQQQQQEETTDRETMKNDQTVTDQTKQQAKPVKADTTTVAKSSTASLSAMNSLAFALFAGTIALVL